MYDAQTGQPIALDLGGYECSVSELGPGVTHFAVSISDDAPGESFVGSVHNFPQTARGCSGLVVYDASTGEKAWEWPVGTARPILQTRTNGDAVIVSYVKGEDECFDMEDGSPLSASDEDCSGAPLEESGNQQEIARLDGVLLTASQLPDGSSSVRANDLETGAALWENPGDPDPTQDQVWRRTETYAATSDSSLRIRYEFEEQEGDDSQDSDATPTFTPTVAVISRVDPRTGEELSQVGKVTGGLFLAQVGDMAVMGVDQDGTSNLAGFRVPAAE